MFGLLASLSLASACRWGYRVDGNITIGLVLHWPGITDGDVHIWVWFMASAMPDLRLASMPHGVTSIQMIASCTTWWQGYICGINLQPGEELTTLWSRVQCPGIVNLNINLFARKTSTYLWKRGTLVKPWFRVKIFKIILKNFRVARNHVWNKIKLFYWLK